MQMALPPIGQSSRILQVSAFGLLLRACFSKKDLCETQTLIPSIEIGYGSLAYRNRPKYYGIGLGRTWVLVGAVCRCVGFAVTWLLVRGAIQKFPASSSYTEMKGQESAKQRLFFEVGCMDLDALVSAC